MHTPRVSVAIAGALTLLACACNKPAPSGTAAATTTESPAPARAAKAAPPEPAPVPEAAAPTEAPDAAAAPNAASSHDEPLDDGRIRLHPRKKKSELQADLDGDGTPETLVGKAEGEGFVVRVLAGERELARFAAPGVMTGWMRLLPRRGRGRVGAFFLYADPDDSAPRTLLALADGGKARIERFPWLPLAHWDWRADGVDAVQGITTELYQDFLPKGRSTLLRLDGDAPVSILPFETFEVCIADPERASGSEPFTLLAVPRAEAAVHLLRVGDDGRYRSVGKRAVTPPGDGSRWTIPSGFALACLGQGLLQYKADRFRIEGDTIVPAPGAEPARP
ncbi:MAG: hypothetical protein RIT45_3491 [Pseudomonadota bacterium]|jgi:hypothetical protein